MNTKASAPTLVVTALVLAGCGGGGGGDNVSVSFTTGTTDIIINPPDQDTSTLAVATLTGSPVFTRSQPSLTGQSSQIVVARDFSVSLIVGDDPALPLPNAESRRFNTAARQDVVTYRSADSDTSATISNPNGTVLPNGAVVSGSLDYASYGVWQIRDTSPPTERVVGIQSQDLAAFYSGIPTTIDEMPINGSASYSGGAIAAERLTANGTTRTLSGAASFDADFARRRMTGTIQLDTSSGSRASLLTTDDIAISANTLTGTITDGSAGTGTIEGLFMGPGAAEVAGTFALDDGTTTLNGGFGAGR